MSQQPIGGHPGLDVIREDGHIRKQAHDRDGNARYRRNRAAVANEVWALELMAGSGWAPEVIEHGGDWMTQTDAGITQPVTDGEELRRHCARMLYAIRARNLRHGDLTGGNLIIRDNRPTAIDWQEAHLLDQTAPQKQPYSDSFLLVRAIANWPDTSGQMDTPRVARRWLAVLETLGAVKDLTLPLKGQTLLDLGCFQGDFVAWAACEGMQATGIDMGGFRTGEDSIAIARELWAGMPEAQFTKANLMDLPAEALQADVSLHMSAWPYLVRDYGRQAAEAFLGRAISGAGVLFFETQLAGDGPGPAFLPDKASVAQLLQQCGAAEVREVVTIPVVGRNAERTVWLVR